MLEPKLKTEIKGLEELVKKYPEASRESRSAKLTEALLLLERAVKLKTPEGAGPIHLRDTFFSKVDFVGEQVKGIFGTPAIHGEPVEYGTRKHFPPVGPIQHWVERKLGLSGSHARSVAFMIARAISRRGTKGAHMVEKGFDESEAAVMRILEEIPDDIARRIGA